MLGKNYANHKTMHDRHKIEVHNPFLAITMPENIGVSLPEKGGSEKGSCDLKEVFQNHQVPNCMFKAMKLTLIYIVYFIMSFS